jgi:hypothetical protein
VLLGLVGCSHSLGVPLLTEMHNNTVGNQSSGLKDHSHSENSDAASALFSMLKGTIFDLLLISVYNMNDSFYWILQS